MGLYEGTSVKELNCSIETKDGKLNPELCKGRYGLVKFYSPGCGHCIGMRNDMILLAKELRRYNFDVLAIDTSQPYNFEIQRRMGIQYVPHMCMYNPKGEIMSIEHLINNSREIPNIVSIISKVTTGETKLLNKNLKSSKLPSNCSIVCEYDGNKLSCKTKGTCYNNTSGGARRKSKKQ